MAVTKVFITYLFVVGWCLFVVCQNTKELDPTPSPTAPLNISSKVAEGGPITAKASPNDTTPITAKASPNDTTHQGREHMLKVASKTTNETHGKNDEEKVNNSKLPDKNHEQERPKPVVPEKNDGKQSVPKKGAGYIEPKPKKPTITESEDDDAEPLKADHALAVNMKYQGNSIEAVTERQKQTDYVVPIVVVILSVPLVAILFSVLYKRGSEWWQHRHYRRMDFLIEGMYNN